MSGSSVESRIVTMKFDNATFEKNAATSLSTLDKVKQSLNFGNLSSGATKALGGVQGILSKFTGNNTLLKSTSQEMANLGTESHKTAAGISTITGGVTSVSKSFIALSTVAITALANITNRAVNAGLAFVKGFTVAPIMDGLHEYETTLQSIQTVQANTDAPLAEVEKSLQRLNAYSDTTIYNFGQMAKNVGTFTAAGVDLKTSVASIQGIANIAALSGSSSEQAATAMYQLSQAIASGKVGLMDWNSVVNAGMGGKKLQNALLQTAVAMGEIGKNSVKLEGPMKKLTVNGKSFRESIMAQPGQESWLSSDILVNTLASLDGRFSVAYQKAQLTENGLRKFTDAQIKSNMAEARANLEKKNGVKYSDEQYKALLKMAEASTKAAQDVKTLGQVFDIAKETIGSGWAASFKNIFGNLKESKKLFTGMSNALGDIIRKNALARNELLASWKEAGGRTAIIKGLTNIFSAFMDVLSPIKKAFRDIFPPNTSKDLVEMSKAFRDFTQRMLLSEDTMDNLRRTFRGIFAVVDIFAQIIKGAVGVIFDLVDATGAGGGGFLEFTGNIGDFLVSVDEMLKKGGGIEDFFNGVSDVIAVPLHLLGQFAGFISSLFSGFDSAGGAQVTDSIDAIGKRLSPLEALGQKIGAIFSGIGHILTAAGHAIQNTLVNVVGAIGDSFGPQTFDHILDVLNTALLGGIVLILRNFFKGGLNVNVGGGGVFDQIKETLSGVTDSLRTMQADIRANILLKIAGALAILTASIVVLSMINQKDLTKALVAMTVMFVAMQVALVSLNTAIGLGGTVKLPLITAALVALSVAMIGFATAIKIFQSMEIGDMARGLLGFFITLKIVETVMKPMGANAGGMIRAAAAIFILGAAMNVLGIALKLFATMSWEEMAKGLVALAGALLIIAGAMQLMPVNMPITAAGILILSVALNALAVALKIFATMSWDDMAHGLVALGGALVVIAAAMQLMPISLPVTAAGLVLVGIALNEIVLALKGMGGMSWKEIGKGLAALGGAMLVLAIGLNGMSGALAGAAALAVAAAALTVLTPVLIVLGNLDWGTILKALATLAGLFVVLGVGGLLLAPITPVILALSVAMLLFGAGVALAGAGMLAFSTGFALLLAALAAGADVIQGELESLSGLVPVILEQFGKGIVAFAGAISSGGPEFTAAMVTIIESMLNAIIRNAPRLADAILAMLNAALKVIVNAGPRIANAGLKLLLNFLTAIRNNIYKIVSVTIQLIAEFIRGIADNQQKLMDAGAKLIIKYIKGLAKTIDENSDELGEAAGELGVAIVKGMVKGLGSMAGVFKDELINVAKGALDGAKDFLGIGSPSKLFRDEVGARLPQGMALGVKDDAHLVHREIESMGQSSLDVMQRAMRGLSDELKLDPSMSPVVTPVLDLTQLQKDATRISAFMPSKTISAGISFAQAAAISSEQQAARLAEGTVVTTEPVVQELKFEQNNYSPKTLPATEIYRNTKSQLELAKEALSIP